MERRSVLVTGCSSGIGLCVARGLAERGYRVFASARRKADVDMLAGLGVDNLEALQLDLDDDFSIRNAVKIISQRTDGKLYALFNNGAYGQPGAVEDLSRDVLRAQFETNFFGWVELTNLVIPMMRKQGEGRIIQNSSVLGFIALPFRGAYNATKFAIEGISDTLRLELHGTGIFVSLIEPGPIESRFRANAFRYYQQNIDREHSAYREVYRRMESRLTKEGPAMPFTLPPEAVLKRVVHALEAKRPRPRYYVTFPTYLFGYLKRLLSTRALDYALRRIAHTGESDEPSEERG